MTQGPSFPPTRAAGLARLADFVEHAGRTYARQRNFDRGPGDRRHVSCLSPWLRHRLVCEPEVLAAVLERHSPAAAEKFVQEVFWRTYFKGWLEQHPRVWPAYREGVDRARRALELDGDLAARYESAVGAGTGIDCFDAWAKELVDTGYLHNHARMWFASLWVFTLELPWELGADFFYRHLLDGDPASNTLGWRWVCGLHTRGKTYLARAANIARYTDGRFDPAGQLASTAPALEEAPEISARRPLGEFDRVSTERAGDDYGLLLTEEDGHPESLDLPHPPQAVVGLTATADRSPLPVSERVRNFAHDALRDTLRRMGEAGVEDRSLLADGSADWGPALAAWADERGLRTLVSAYPPTGPVAEGLAAAETALAEAGIRVLRLTRAYDRCAWPHAGRGFFQLKKRIPELLRAAGLPT